MHSRHRIVPVTSPWCAAQQSPRREPGTLDRTILPQGILRVHGTRRLIPAGIGQRRRNRFLINRDCSDQEPGRQRRSTHWINSSRNSGNDASYASRLARISTSKFRLASRGSTSSRTTSRNLRFRRLRCTELCRYLGTMMPARACERGEVESKTSRWAVLLLFPR